MRARRGRSRRPPATPSCPSREGGSRGYGAARASAERASRDYSAVELVSHPAFTYLHPTGGHPESQERIAVLHQGFPFVECAPAHVDDVLRCHSPAVVEQVRSARGWLDSDTICTETTFEAALLAAGAAIEAVHLGGFALAGRPATTRRTSDAMGFCLFNSVAIAARARADSGSSASRSSTGTCTTATGRRTSSRRRARPLRLAPPVAVLPRNGRPGASRRGNASSTSRSPRAAGDADYLRRSTTVGPRSRLRARSAPRLGRLRRARDDPLAQLSLSSDAFRMLARRASTLAPRVAAVLEGGYNVATLPGPRRERARGLFPINRGQGATTSTAPAPRPVGRAA